MNYTPLYIKTDNSFFSSLIKVNDLVEFASNHNLKSLAIADNSLYGVMDFYMLCKKNNIKPIIGLEVKIDNSYIVLYAMNYNGYKNIIKLNIIQSKREVTLNDLNLHSLDLICLIPFAYANLYDELKKLYANIYITYKNELEKNNITVDSLYANEILCLNKEDLKYLTYLDKIASRDAKKYLDNYFILEKDLKLLNDNNYKIYDMCNVEIPLEQNLMPAYENEENLSSYDYLKKLCIEGMKNKFGDSVSKVYQDRLKHELDVINKMHFNDYFLIVADYVNWAKANNILVGPGRGSAVSSLVAYLLGITEVDPVKNDLLFERFLNEDRVSMPDIDMDFEHLKREDVINYCISKYGRKCVVPIIAFGTMGTRQVIRETSSILGIDNYIINNLNKILDANKSLADNLKNKEIANYINNNNLKELISIALKLEGLKHHTSLHAAGIVMSSKSLDEVIPIVSYNDKFVTGIDMTYLEKIGLLKMDFLAIKYLTIIHEIIDDINSNYDNKVKFEDIPLDDKKAMEIFEYGNTLGIFQFESDGMINFLRKLKPTTFEDLTLAMALFRPGPMQNIDTFINNRKSPDKIKYIDDSIIDILKPTCGILVYQEQIMQIAMKLASYTKGEADILRKAMSKKKKELLANEEDKFVKGCLANNITLDKAKEIFNLMLKFAEYGFNKSHSYGYSLVSYRMAYLKAYYPNIFMAHILNEDMNDKDKLKKYFKECKKNNINILKPSINSSTNKFKEEKGALLYPLNGIKDVPLALVNRIIDEVKNKPFIDIFDFIARIYYSGLTNKIMENLIKASAFERLGINMKTLITNLDVIMNYGELVSDIGSDCMKPVLTECDDYDLKEKLTFEKELFGIYLSNHPAISYKSKLNNIKDANVIEEYFDKDINLVLVVDSFRKIMTKKNDQMGFIAGSDETDDVELVMFPKTFKKYENIEEGNVILVNGKVEKRFDQYQVVINKLKVLE